MSNESENKSKTSVDTHPSENDEFEEMEVEEEIDDPTDLDDEIEGEIISPDNDFDVSPSGTERRHHRKKRRIKVKKRVRVSKKKSSKRFYKKLVERVIWAVFIAGFITVLVVLFKQLDISDEKYKSGKKKGWIQPVQKSNIIYAMVAKENKQHQLINIVSI